MKHFLTVTMGHPTNAPDEPDVEEHDTEDAARQHAEKTVLVNPTAEVKVYRFVTRARAETVTRFDGGCES